MMTTTRDIEDDVEPREIQAALVATLREELGDDAAYDYLKVIRPTEYRHAWACQSCGSSPNNCIC
jgi:hypothetical protein